MSKMTEAHGWTAVPRSLNKLVAGAKDAQHSSPIKVEDIPIPDTPLAQTVMQYAKQHLPEQTFNHSMRVYYYGMPPNLFLKSPSSNLTPPAASTD